MGSGSVGILCRGLMLSLGGGWGSKSLVVGFDMLLSAVDGRLSSVTDVTNSSAGGSSVARGVLVGITSSVLILGTAGCGVSLRASVPLASISSSNSVAIGTGGLGSALSGLSRGGLIGFGCSSRGGLLMLSGNDAGFSVHAESSVSFPSFSVSSVSRAVILGRGRLGSVVSSYLLYISGSSFESCLHNIHFSIGNSGLSVFASSNREVTVLSARLSGPSASTSPFNIVLAGEYTSRLTGVMGSSTSSSIVLSFAGGTIRASYGGCGVGSGLVGYNCPGMEAIVPGAVSSVVSVPGSAFAGLVGRISILSSGEIGNIAFAFNNNRIALESSGSSRSITATSLTLPSTRSGVSVSLGTRCMESILNIVGASGILFYFDRPVVRILVGPSASIGSLNMGTDCVVDGIMIWLLSWNDFVLGTAFFAFVGVSRLEVLGCHGVSSLSVSPSALFGIVCKGGNSNGASLLSTVSCLNCKESFQSSQCRSLVESNRSCFTVSTSIVESDASLSSEVNMYECEGHGRSLSVSVGSGADGELISLMSGVSVRIVRPRKVSLVLNKPSCEHGFVS